jgi:PLP dependent protein
MDYLTLLAKIPAPARLLAVSKTKPAAAVAGLHAQGQIAFGENYVQEALAKMQALAELPLEWHLIGPLQSNKCKEVAFHFDWLHSVDRIKLIEPLARFRAQAMQEKQVLPLNVLIQVNIDDESSKSGCAPSAVPELADAISAHPSLRFRGLMAIPQATAEPNRAAFARMREIYLDLQGRFAIDTLSMGMSQDFEVALEYGATLVRIGSALFGARN